VDCVEGTDYFLTKDPIEFILRFSRECYNVDIAWVPVDGEVLERSHRFCATAVVTQQGTNFTFRASGGIS